MTIEKIVSLALIILIICRPTSILIEIFLSYSAIENKKDIESLAISPTSITAEKNLDKEDLEEVIYPQKKKKKH
ncbi:MAG: hypothetical protein GX931_01375 [Acholeplasmataceae bacterium]|jgi:hypothetical protein|nr:hypothetical protein [Acholeplasmataceae bacterium]